MGIKSGIADATLIGEIEFVEVKRGVATIRFGGVTHQMRTGSTFTVTLNGHFRLNTAGEGWPRSGA